MSPHRSHLARSCLRQRPHSRKSPCHKLLQAKKSNACKSSSSTKRMSAPMRTPMCSRHRQAHKQSHVCTIQGNTLLRCARHHVGGQRVFLIATAVAALNDQCVGRRGLECIDKQLSSAPIGRCHVTSRVLVPQQNLADGTLVLRVLPAGSAPYEPLGAISSAAMKHVDSLEILLSVLVSGLI